MGRRKSEPVCFDERLVCLGLSASNDEAVIRKLAGMLSACGAVDPDYAEAACARERQYPTGLPTRGVGVAIPHADGEHVRFNAVAMATCTPAVAFRNMANPSERLPVELVIMIAMADASGQVEVLRRLAEAFGEPDVLATLRAARTPAEAVRVMRMQVLSSADN